MVEEEPRALAPRKLAAVDGDAIGGRDIARRRGDHLTLDRNPPPGDPRLGFAARTKPPARDDLGKAPAPRKRLVLPAPMPHPYARCRRRGVIADHPARGNKAPHSHRRSVDSARKRLTSAL